MSTKTKIICTIGPASRTRPQLRQMIRAGMNIARLNFSHGDHTEHAYLIRTLRAAAHDVGRSIAIMQDLQGPRLRLGKLHTDTQEIFRRKKVILLPPSDYRHAHHESAILLPLQFQQLSRWIKHGDTILLHDGTIQLVVERVQGSYMYCRATNSGIVRSFQGINVPGSAITMSILTAKDQKDLAFGLHHGIDMVALSFVRNGKDINNIRRRLPKKSNIAIIAKIEREEAVTNIAEIIEVADVVMVARGDLGVELGAAKVALLQKNIIQMCVERAVPVIVATQMLESMTQNPLPTRAEATDVANAVIDHADALMLSGETAQGAYPVSSVRMMASIIREIENSTLDDTIPSLSHHHEENIPQRIVHEAIAAAETARASILLMRMRTLREVAYATQLRSLHCRIIACATDPMLIAQTQVLWGITGLLVSSFSTRWWQHAITKLVKQHKITPTTRVFVLEDYSVSAWKIHKNFFLVQNGK